MPMTSSEAAARLRRYQAALAPGTALRDGLERIVNGRTGALIVLGHGRAVRQVSSGGFAIDVPFTPTALRELAKLDGGIIVSHDLDRILMAGVHFVPDGSLPTPETGTRHRSADRVSQQARVPVVTVSASMSTIALFMDGSRYPIARPEQLLARANQALATLTSYRSRLNTLTAHLSSLEVRDQVSARDVALVAQRLEMARRLDSELREYTVQLGVEGRLLRMQLQELTMGIDELADHLAADYADDAATSFGPDGLAGLWADELFNIQLVSTTFGFASDVQLDDHVTARGIRQLASIPRLPVSLGPRLLEHFGSLQNLLAATTSELREVEGVGDQRARNIRDGLIRLSESAYLDR